MKTLLLLLLLTTGVYAQKQVFNVQHYCVDEKPLKQGQCDQKGNEYSFLFLDVPKKEVVFFLTNIKFQYQITATQSISGYTVYKLQNDSGETTMKVNTAKTKIELLSPDSNIILTVGKSTKAEKE